MPSSEPLVSRIPREFQNSEDPAVIEYILPSFVECLDWFEDYLVYGHDLGVTILSRIQDLNLTNSYPTQFQRNWSFDKTYIHLGMPVQVVKMYNSLIACVHYNQNQITLINTQSSSNSDTPSSAGIEKKVLGGSRGHSSYINSVDISPEGLVASTGDDRRLLLWDESGSPQNFPLDGAGKLVKFWSAPFGDVLIVLEAGNKIRLLDYNKSEWILTIYPGQAGCCGPMTGNVRSFFVNNNYLYAVGVGWWKKYDLTNVQGGCGYTQPVVEESFITKPDKFSFVVTSSLGSSGNGSSSDTTIGVASQNTQYIYDTAKEDSTKLYALNYTLSSDEIAAAAIRNEGDLLAIASGKLLTLVRNPNSKYPWVN